MIIIIIIIHHTQAFDWSRKKDWERRVWASHSFTLLWSSKIFPKSSNTGQRHTVCGSSSSLWIIIIPTHHHDHLLWFYSSHCKSLLLLCYYFSSIDLLLTLNWTVCFNFTGSDDPKPLYQLQELCFVTK